MAMTVSNNIPNSIVDVATAGKNGTYGVVKLSNDDALIIADGVLTQTAEFKPATDSEPGLVKIDGETIKIDANGIISGAKPINIASTGAYGSVIPDGKSIKIQADGTVSSDGTPPIADTITKGIVKPDGTSITIDLDGTIHAKIDTSKIGVFKADTITDVGSNGVVPQPKMGDEKKYLHGDGTWGKIYVEAPQVVKDRIDKLINDESTTRANKDTELNTAVDAIQPGQTPSIAVGNMSSFSAKPCDSNKIKLTLGSPLSMYVTPTTKRPAVISKANGYKVVRKEGSYPTSPTDGKLLVDVTTDNFSEYQSKGYIDSDGIVGGTTYYYAIFPYNDDGVNMNGDDANHAKCTAVEAHIYGFDIWQEVANPEERVKYPDDVLNASWQPMTVTQQSDTVADSTFDLGDWGNTFFVQGIRPVMLNPDGTVAYELDHDDQTIKKDRNEDGSTISSEITDNQQLKNAMVEFPKIYFKRWTDDPKVIDNNTVTISHVRICDVRYDKDYHCYAHMNGNSLIPTMTSNTTPSGIASCSDAWSNMDAWTAFRHYSSGWHPSDTSNNFNVGHWVQYQFIQPTTFNMITEGNYTSTAIPSSTFDIKISNDGVNFITIGRINHVNGTYTTVTFNQDYTCNYIRFEFSQNFGYSNNSSGFDFTVGYEAIPLT